MCTLFTVILTDVLLVCLSSTEHFS